MSLFRSSLRPPAPISDEAIERYLAAIRAQIDPDPLFRRRLRGDLVNRFVAAREGMAEPGTPPREMGRLGRAVLYATFTVGLSVTGAMAASQQAIPGEVFYPVKVQIEQLRLEIVPERLRDDLAAYALGQRIEELHRLTESGNWTAITAHAEAVEAAYDTVVALSPNASALAEHLEVAGGLLDRLPDQARAAVEQAMATGGGHGPTMSPAGGGDGGGPTLREPVRGPGPGGGPPPASPAADRPQSQGGAGGEAAEPTPRPKPEPSKTPKATKSPRPTASPEPGSADDVGKPGWESESESESDD